MHAAWELLCTARMSVDLGSFIRTPISMSAAHQLLQRRLQQREAAFLSVLEHVVYANARSPYRRMLRAMSCEFADIRAMVNRDGVEGALGKLADEGFYLTFDEFKGRAPVVRGGWQFRFSDRDFDNPQVRSHFILWTGGSRNPAMAVRVSLDFVADMAVHTAVALEANGLSDHRHAYWLFSTALTLALRQVKLGRSPLAWFYPLSPIPWKGQLGARWLAWLSSRLGRRLPAPEHLDLREPDRMMDWLVRAARHGPVLLTCYASSMVRICRAAIERGVPLSDVCFVTFGEPFTEAKRVLVEAAGARAVSHYGFTEGGLVGYSCANPTVSDDVHVFDNAYAILQRPRAIGQTGESVDAFLLTTLLRSAPKVMLNVEPGDHGLLQNRSCGCGLESIGLRRHMALIRSYEKLTSEGMTFAKGGLLRLLETVLPERFGGSLVDYQLVEEEDEGGIVRLNLLVSPRVGPIDEGALRQVFLAELSRDGGPTRTGAAAWERADTVRIRRCEPMPTAAGKILPFHLIRH